MIASISALFSSAMFISHSSNFATRKPAHFLISVSAAVFLDDCHGHYECSHLLSDPGTDFQKNLKTIS